MPIQLNDVEARILGSLVEKSLATPENYPLSLNALINACNQKTSREPVTALDEAAVGRGLHALLEKGLAERRFEPGSRVPKFLHHVEALLPLADVKQVATLCVLLLRGPQTAGEIKARTDRLCKLESTAEAEALLQDLAARADGPFAVKLPKQPGQKEARYQHLFSGAPAPAASPADSAPAPADRLALLEKRIETLEAAVKLLQDPRAAG